MFENYQLDLAAGNGMTKNSSSSQINLTLPRKRLYFYLNEIKTK